MDPAEYPLPGACRVSGQYRAGAARQYSPVKTLPVSSEQLASLVLLNVPPGAQFTFHVGAFVF